MKGDMTMAGAAGRAWDEAEPHVFQLLLKVALWVSAVIAAPFFALAFGFFLFDRPWLWVGIAAGIGLFVVAMGAVVAFVIRARLRRFRETLVMAERVETILMPPQP